MSKGFLGTATPRAADLTLLAESAMGLALIMSETPETLGPCTSSPYSD